MADELLSTGLSIDDFATRLNIVTGDLRTAISAILDVSEDQPTGQFVRIIVDAEQQIAELLQELHSAIDPDQATGQSFDAVCSMTGTYRRDATAGTALVNLTFTGAAVVPAGSLVSVSGDPDNQWSIDATQTWPGGPGVIAGVAVTSTQTGAIPALAGTITVIDTPIANWSAVTNPAAATEGLDRETDTELRLRREVELTTGGSTSVDAIAAAVSNEVANVSAVVVYENDSWRAVAPMPPHSIEVVYWPGTVVVADLVETIFEEKAGGIQAYGTVYTSHTDSQGNSHQIGSTLATEFVLQVRYSLTTDSDYPGDADFSAAVAAAANADSTQLGIGDDVIIAKYYDYGFDVAGVLDITALDVWNGAAWVAVNLAIGPREIATLIAGNVTVV